jgi:FHA domain-containing protein
MVLLMRAVSFKGRPVMPELSARFEEGGGTIGRGQNNALVLPDPERYISRIHATVSFQAGGFIITDNGTKNPVVLNGRMLGQGSQAKLADGDTVKIGDYLLEVSLGAAGGVAVPTPVRTDRDDAFVPPARPTIKDDPFADLFGPKAPASPLAPPRPPWPDPPVPKEPTPVAADPLASLRPDEPRIDDILGSTPPSADALLGEPSPVPAGRTPILPDDPFENWPGLGKANRPPAIPDHTPELNLPFFPPDPRPDPVSTPVASTPIVIEPPVVPPPVPPSPSPSPARLEAVPPVSDAPSAAAAPPARDDLLRAFLRGAGIPEARLPISLTPETMEMLGQLVHGAVKGTVELLRARATTKGEMRADVTMIMPVDNNPLKFSPSAEAALVHLLAPSVPGFSSPVRAMKEAYDDLRAHQLGFLAGMRAALDEVLARFEPQGLEQRLSDPGLFGNLLPATRKAKLWDLFVERYADVAADAREDFHAAFGKAFLRAYNEQVKRLRAEDRRG